MLLSDGADTGSAIAQTELAEQARAAGVRVFTVGLRSHRYEAEPLEELARTTGGRYAEASSAEALERVFADLGSRLASEYLVRYRSAAPPDERVHVAVRVEEIGGVGVSAYTTPAAPEEPGPPYRRPLLERFVQSGAGTVATSIVCALVVALGLVAVIRPRPRTLRRRMAEFVSVARSERPDDARSNDLVLAKAEQQLAETRWWVRFQEELEIGEIRIPPMHILLATLVGTLFVAWFFYVLTGTILFVLLGLGVPVRRALTDRAPGGAAAEPLRRAAARQPPRARVRASRGAQLRRAPSRWSSTTARTRRRRSSGVWSRTSGSARRSTRPSCRSPSGCAAATSSRSPSWRRSSARRAATRPRCSTAWRRRCAERFDLRRLVRTLTAQGRMSRWVLSLLPVGLLVLMTLINPAYVAPLYFNPVGRILLVVAGVMVVAGSLVIKRIVNIKV